MIFDRVRYQKDGIHSKAKVVLKNKTKNCSTCMWVSFKEYKTCPKNSLIFSSRLDSKPSVFKSPHLYINPCDLRYYGLESEIEDYQNKLGIRKGEIAVQKEIEMSKHYKKYGGKEGFYKHLQDIAMNII